jgi:hypothetical protein
MVLVNSSDPDDVAHEPPSGKGSLDRLSLPARHFFCRIIPVLSQVGVMRAWLAHQQPASNVPNLGITPDQWFELRTLSFQPTGYVAYGSESCSAEEESAAEVRAAGNLGSRPLVVLSSTKPFADPSYNEYWVNNLQPRLAKLSTRGRLEIVEGNGLPPNAIVHAIRQVVTEARSGQSN